MFIDDDHLYHGAALLQIAEHKRFTAINPMKTTSGTARSTFRINDDIGIYLKYASKPKGAYDEYLFTFTNPHIAEVDEIAGKVERAFVGLVCVRDKHICCLSHHQLHRLVANRKKARGADEAAYTIVANLPRGKQFRVYVNAPGKKGKIAGGTLLVPRNSFPDMLFK